MPSRRRTARPNRAGVAVAAGIVICASVACSNQQPSVNRRPHEGSATASVVAGVSQVTVQAGDTYRFTPSTITVHPGTVRIVLENVGKGAPHNLTFLGFAAATADAASGQSQSVTFTAPAPGTYTFVCTIHERQGQTGKLVVLPG
jgi:plastocyanin